MARVLLVDDEPDARRMLSVGLERLGHAVETRADGTDALAALRPDTEVVVTDLVMPRLDGLALLRALTERDHPAARVVITSFADKDRTVAALNLGADFLIEKPFSVAQLEQVIRTVLSKQDNATVERFFQRRLAALPITDRERQLVTYVLKGLANAEIGPLLGISEQAVKSALFALYRKLGIASRGELFHHVFPV
jgi:DNA-binding NarL/FixJ family response regulator